MSETDHQPIEPPRSGVFALPYEERLALAMALLKRPRRRPEGREAVQAAFPQAPQEMTDTAAHHLFGDGVDAAVDLLAAAELMLRSPGRDLDQGAVQHLAYHLYNWMQFIALLPDGKQELLDLVAQLKEAVRENDMEFVRHTAQLLDDVVGGSRSHPVVEEP